MTFQQGDKFRNSKTGKLVHIHAYDSTDDTVNASFDPYTTRYWMKASAIRDRLATGDLKWAAWLSREI